MLEAVASFWHTLVFLWAVVMTIVVCYDHWDRVHELAEWVADLFRGVR